MFSFMLAGLEKAVNTYLQFDPETIKKVAEIKGKIIKIELIDWNFSFFIQPSSNGLYLSISQHQKTDTIIRGKLINLLRVGQAQASNKALFDNAVEIAGDIETGAAIRTILQEIDIDWEEHLSKIIGDGLAHQAVFFIKKTFQRVKKSTQSLEENIKEYIVAEAQLTPTKDQVDNFYQEVSCLRDDVARCSARVERLLNNKNKESL